MTFMPNTPICSAQLWPCDPVTTLPAYDLISTTLWPECRKSWQTFVEILQIFFVKTVGANEKRNFIKCIIDNWSLVSYIYIYIFVVLFLSQFCCFFAFTFNESETNTQGEMTRSLVACVKYIYKLYKKKTKQIHTNK